MNRIQWILKTVLLAAVGCGFFFSMTGCGYVKNVRDDFLDIGSVAVGGAVPAGPPQKGEETESTILPVGIYAQATDILHVGAIQKTTTDLSWDRRGLAITRDNRAKFSFGPAHFIRIDQAPVIANAYKTEDNELDGWRNYMRQWEGPFFETPAKELIFRQKEGFLPYFYQGWRDWDGISLELAISDPFILHSGVYARVGAHPGQAVDFVLSLFALDFLYYDAAYNLDGTTRFPDKEADN